MESYTKTIRNAEKHLLVHVHVRKGLLMLIRDKKSLLL